MAENKVTTEALNVERSTPNAQGRKLWLVCRVLDFLIGGLFIYAGVLKVIDPVGFANDIDNYKTLPWAVGVGLAFYLPWLEILCGIALILRRLYLGGLTMLTGLLVVLIGASMAAKARGIDITCGCFGHVSKDLSFTWHLLLDFAILAALVILWWQCRALRASHSAKEF